MGKSAKENSVITGTLVALILQTILSFTFVTFLFTRLCAWGDPPKGLGQSQPSDCLNAFNYHDVEMEPWFSLLVCVWWWWGVWYAHANGDVLAHVGVFRDQVVFIYCFSKFLRNWPGWRLSFRQTSWLVSFGYLPVSKLCWGWQTQVAMPGFYIGAEVPTFTLPGYTASTLSRELNPGTFLSVSENKPSQNVPGTSSLWDI